MAHNYANIKFKLSKSEPFKTEGHYEFKIKNKIYKKTAYLSYQIIDSMDEILVEDFMKKFFSIVISNRFLKTQSDHILWKKLVIENGSETFHYLLPVDHAGHFRRGVKTDAYYRFEI